MKVIVSGSGGMLGQAVVTRLRASGHQVQATTRADLDVRSLTSCRSAVATGVDAVVNASAWTDVDGAETAEGAAFEVNATGAANLALAAAEVGARLVQISTDYVFDGHADQPYSEDAPLAPRSAYGRGKAAGEWAVRGLGGDALVVRTAWLYGPGGSSFVATMLRLAETRATLSVVDDQRGQPTTTHDVARYVDDLLAAGAPAGTYHATSEGDTTWFGLARAVFEEAGLDAGRVHPTSSADYPRPAPRPAYSVLGHDRTRAAGITLLPPWRESLAAVLPSLGGRG